MFSAVNFSQFLVIKTLDPNPHPEHRSQAQDVLFSAKMNRYFSSLLDFFCIKSHGPLLSRGLLKMSKMLPRITVIITRWSAKSPRASEWRTAVACMFK